MKTADVFGCAAWASFILLASAWIPLLGPFLSLLTPLPFIYCAYRSGLPAGLKAAALTLAAVGAISHLSGQPQVVLLGIEFSLLGLALSEVFRKKLSLGYTLLSGTGFMLLLGFAFLLFISLSKEAGPFQMLLNYLQGNLRETIDAYEKMGVGPEKASELRAYGEVLIAAISRIYPSLMIIGTGSVVWINVVLAMRLFRMKKIEAPAFAPMDRWEAPALLVWAVIVSGFSMFLLSGSLQTIAINVFIVAMAVYLFHGLSILLFFFNKYKVPSLIRAGVYVLMLFQQLFLAVLALAGLFDQWIDFRKIHKTG